MYIHNAVASSCIFVQQTAATDAVYIDNDNNNGNSGLYVDNTGSVGPALYAYSNRNNGQNAPLSIVYVDNTGFDNPSFKIINDGAGDGMLIDNNGNSNAINIDYDGTAAALYINSAASKPSIVTSDGAEGHPAYSFHGDDDTGMYRISGDTLGFSIGGSKRWTMASDGNWFPNSNYHVGTSSKPIGTLYYTSGTLGSSDKTLKDNIQECDLGTDFINKLKPISFNWKESVGVNIDTTLTNYGLVAQDVLDTELKDSIDGDKECEYKMNYNHLFAPMIKAIQELSSKNKALEAKVTALENA